MLYLRHRLEDGFRLEYHTGTTAVGVVINGVMLVVAIVPDIVDINLNQLVSHRPLEDAGVERCLKHAREYSQDVNSQMSSPVIRGCRFLIALFMVEIRAGTGGEEATVTDADVLLGYISPDYFLGGEMKLRRDLAEKAVKEKVAGTLGISIHEAAAAIYKVSNSVMANGVATTFNRRGYDPRDFVLCAGGAAGPTCALKIAQELSISRVLIPKYAPIFCAFGMLGVDLRHDFTRFYRIVENKLDFNKLNSLYKEMESEAISKLNEENVPENQLPPPGTS